MNNGELIWTLAKTNQKFEQIIQNSMVNSMQ